METIITIVINIVIICIAIQNIVANQIIYKQQTKIEELNKVIQGLLATEITKQIERGE